MRIVDIYDVNRSDGYGTYGLVYEAAASGLKQIGVESSISRAQTQRFTTADGTPILYTGYAEREMTLTLECGSRSTANQVRTRAVSGAFAASGILAADVSSSTTFGRIFHTTGDVTTTCVSRHDGIYQVEIPVLLARSGFRVPAIQLATPNGSATVSGLSFAGVWIYTDDCRTQEDSALWLTSPVWISPNTSQSKLCVAASTGFDTGDFTILLQHRSEGSTGGWFTQAIDTDEASTLPGADIELPDGNAQFNIRITAPGAKPLQLYFNIRRYGT